MSKLGRKVSALLLATSVVISTVVPAFAANSPTTGNTPTGTPVAATDGASTVEGTTTSDTTAAVNKVSSTDKTAVIPNTIKANSKDYLVDEIKTGTIKDKYNKVTMILNSTTKVDAQVAQSKKAKKTKKIVIQAADGQKLKAAKFNKKAFKGFKGKVVVKKSAMSKKEFNKLKKKLKKGGFKGKISRVK